MSEKLAEQLAEKVSNEVISAGVRETLLQALLDAVRGNTQEAVLKALLLYAGSKVAERDREWVLQLSHMSAPRAKLHGISSPNEVAEEITKWQNAKEKDVRVQEYRAGFAAGQSKGFREGILQGTRLGWGGGEVGKKLEEVLEAARNAVNKG